MRRKASLRALAALAALRARAVADGSCAEGWREIHGRCYWLSGTSHTFERCQVDVCRPKNASLACIRSEDAEELTDFVGGAERDLLAAWIGYTKATPDKHWVWLNGCPNDWTYWLAGEPNDYCGGEDCAALTNPSGGWAEVSCRLSMPCLCEYPLDPSTLVDISEPMLRDDTCYSECGDLTRWCSAWPFLRMNDIDGDVCSWETEDGTPRGRGASQCASWAASHPECGPYLAYSVGRCRCSPAEGVHMNCTHREPDVASDIFFRSDNGPQLAYSGQRCVYMFDIETEYFSTLRPPGTWGGILKNWLRAAAVWLAFGLPCGAVMAWTLWRMFFGRAAQPMEESRPSGPSGAAGAVDAAYGTLLEADNDDDSGQVVNRWVFRAASSTIIYGLALLGLGGTLAAHMAGRSTGFQLELVESLVMAISMSLVTRAACMVHRRLAPIARQVAGPWVLVVALASFGMALTALCGVLVFSTLADADYENICFAQYLFRWSMLLVLPFECLAGFATWQLQFRAQRYAGKEEARAGGWASLLVTGYFGAGAWVWWAGYLDCVHEAGPAVAAAFVVSAVSQLTAGVSLLMVNWKVKQYFRRNDSTSGGAVAADGAPPLPATQLGYPTLEDEPPSF